MDGAETEAAGVCQRFGAEVWVLNAITRANSFCGISFFCMEVTGNEVKCLIPALPSKWRACVLFSFAHGRTHVVP